MRFMRYYGELSLGNNFDAAVVRQHCSRMHACGYEGVYLSDVFFTVDQTKENPRKQHVLFEEDDCLILQRPAQDLDDLMTIVKANNLRLHSAHFLQMLPPPETNAESIFAFHERLLGMAAHLQLKILTTHAGWMQGVADSTVMGDFAVQFHRKEISLEELYAAAQHRYGTPAKLHADTLTIYRHLCDEAAEADILITIESACREWLALSGNPTALKDFIFETGATNLGICVDAGHCHMQGISPADFIRASGDLFLETHFHDNYGDRDAHAPIGHGNIDWPAVIDAMNAVNYRGTIAFEQQDWEIDARNWKKLISAQNPIFGIAEWSIPQLRFDKQGLAAARTVFCQSNGFMGIPGYREEEAARTLEQSGNFMTGLYELQTGIEAFLKGKPILPNAFHRAANTPQITELSLQIGTDIFSADVCRNWQRTFDMTSGELSLSGCWCCSGGEETDVLIKRAVSLHNPHLFISSLTLTARNHELPITITSRIDAAVNSSYLGNDLWQNIETETHADGTISLRAHTKESELKVQILASHKCSDPSAVQSTDQQAQQIACKTTIPLTRAQSIHFDKQLWCDWSCPTDKDTLDQNISWDNANADSQFEVNAAAWQQFWNQCDIRIDGDNAAQQGIRFCLSQLKQAYRKELPTSVTAKGLTGEGYGLLCFWDSEIYLLPFYLYTQPELAKQILMFRYRTLDQARLRAQAMNYAGAMFPWMTVNGEDNPGAWECVLGEQHINAAIPYAIEQYVGATGDDEWLAEYGAEIVIECARFWASRVFFNTARQKYVITQVTGPDEYTEMVNNDCYTNMMAARALNYATTAVTTIQHAYPEQWLALAKHIQWSDTEAERWSDIADSMYVPYDEKRGLHPQDDSFFNLDELDLSQVPPDQFGLEGHWAWPNVLRYQVLKQPAVVLANFLLSDQFTPEQKLANYNCYEPKTTHDSSLSPSIHAIMAVELDLAEKVREYFLKTVRLDLDDTKSDGVHLANAGGAWMAMVNGFAGFRQINGQFNFDPAILPEWKSYSFQLLLRGRRILISARTTGTNISLLDGTPLKLFVRNREYLLRDNIEISTRVL